jgi:hypothetical protein
MKDLHNNIKTEVAFNTAAISSDTTTNGAIIDMQGFDSVEFVIQSATLTDGSYTPLLEESDNADLSSSNAVADAHLLGTEATAAFALADDNTVKKLGYIGNKRYVRLSLVSASTSTGGTLSAVVVKGHAADRPVT